MRVRISHRTDSDSQYPPRSSPGGIPSQMQEPPPAYPAATHLAACAGVFAGAGAPVTTAAAGTNSNPSAPLQLSLLVLCAAMSVVAFKLATYTASIIGFLFSWIVFPLVKIPCAILGYGLSIIFSLLGSLVSSLLSTALVFLTLLLVWKLQTLRHRATAAWDNRVLLVGLFRMYCVQRLCGWRTAVNQRLQQWQKRKERSCQRNGSTTQDAPVVGMRSPTQLREPLQRYREEQDQDQEVCNAQPKTGGNGGSPFTFSQQTVEPTGTAQHPITAKPEVLEFAAAVHDAILTYERTHGMAAGTATPYHVVASGALDGWSPAKAPAATAAPQQNGGLYPHLD